jgi:molecular chaperone HtpG
MAKRTRKFKTEIQQLLDLIIHSLYSKKEIFLRELISNASDAIDRMRFESLTDKALQSGDQAGRIELVPDKESRTLTVRDNGIGMSMEEVEANIGTIANSGTRRFLEVLQENQEAASPELIGQFGVGFYASFMVADRVEVVTRRAGTDAAIRWTSKGAGNYTLEDAERETHGTDVILHLSEGQDEFLEEYSIRRIVKAYSDYIAYPVVMDVTRSTPAKEEGGEPTETVESETLNSMKAIWKRPQEEVTEEEYHEFYKHVSHDYTDPLRIIHYAAEGTTEFRALVYLPAKAPWNFFVREENSGIHLYVRNVFITDDCKTLMPEYLRFVKGMVDSSDLPLNVSREMLQDDAILKRISKSLVGRILKELGDLKEKDLETYRAFYSEFGPVLKEGVYFDAINSDKIQDLLLFPSNKSGDGAPVSLKDYVDRMPETQEAIYFISGPDRETVARSPHLELFEKKGYEVLFFVDSIDEWVAERLTEFGGKPLKAVDRGDIDLGADTEEEKKEQEANREAATEEYGDLLKRMQERLDEDVKEVRLSSRLTDSACCLVADEAGMNANMERIMRSMNQAVPATKRILEVNPDHAVLARLKSLHEADPEGDKLTDYIDLLYNQALLTEGSAPKDALRFTRLVSGLMAEAG